MSISTSRSTIRMPAIKVVSSTHLNFVVQAFVKETYAEAQVLAVFFFLAKQLRLALVAD